MSHLKRWLKVKRPFWALDLSEKMLSYQERSGYEFAISEDTTQACPYRRLIAATLTMAIDDCLRRPMPRFHRDEYQKRLDNFYQLRRDAWKWLAKREVPDPQEYSAQWICEHPDLDRRHVLKFVRKKQKQFGIYTQPVKVK